jgi:hypothetical protein
LPAATSLDCVLSVEARFAVGFSTWSITSVSTGALPDSSFNFGRLLASPLHDLRTAEILRETFDGTISNFGALNCVLEYEATASVLGRLIRQGGKLAICLAGPVFAREFGHFLIRAQAVKTFRRLSASDYKGIPLTYPSLARLTHAFSGDFALINWYGVGLCVPPSYMGGLHERTIARLAHMDRRIAHWPVLRSIADHRLLIFKRL